MEVAIIYPKNQFVIPRKIRELLHLTPGQKVQIVAYGNRIELIPERQISEMRGFLKGANISFQRELDRV